MRTLEPAEQTAGTSSKSLAGALAYVTFIPALVFLLLDRYRKNSFVRFHSVQCLLLWAAAILLGIILRLVSPVFFIIPVVGPLIAFLVAVLAALAALLLWLVLLVKAYQGERFQLPLLGHLAERYSASPTA